MGRDSPARAAAGRPRSEYQRHRIQVLIRMGARPARGRARESCYGVRRAVPLPAASQHAAGAGCGIPLSGTTRRQEEERRLSAARAGPRGARRARHNKPTEKTLNGVYPHVPLAHRDRLCPRPGRVGVRAARGFFGYARFDTIVSAFSMAFSNCCGSSRDQTSLPRRSLAYAPRTPCTCRTLCCSLPLASPE